MVALAEYTEAQLKTQAELYEKYSLAMKNYINSSKDIHPEDIDNAVKLLQEKTKITSQENTTFLRNQFTLDVEEYASKKALQDAKAKAKKDKITSFAPSTDQTADRNRLNASFLKFQLLQKAIANLGKATDSLLGLLPQRIRSNLAGIAEFANQRRSPHSYQDGKPYRAEIVTNTGKRLVVGVTSDGVTQGGENSKYVADMVTQLVGKYLSESLETDDSNIREAMQNAIDRANEDILAITGDSTGFNGSSTAGIYVLDTTENMLHTATIADSVILVVDRSVSKAYVASKIVDINRNDVYEGIATGYTFQTAKSPQVQDMFSSQQARAQYASFHLSPGRDFVILSGSDHLQSLVGWELVKPADGNNKTREFDIAVKGQYVSVRNPVSGKIESRKAIGLLRWVLGTQFEVPTVMMNRISKAFETNRGDDLGIIIEDVRGGGTLKPNQTVRINTIDAAITSEGPKKFIIGSGEFVNIFFQI